MRTRRTRHRPVGAALAAAAVLCCLLPAGCKKDATPTTAPADKGQTPDKTDAGYVQALAVANAYCRAWQKKDWAAAKELLSDALQQRHPAERLVNAVIGAPNHAHEAYEVSNGQRLTAGRYAFDVRLHVRLSGGWEDRAEARRERIVIARDASGKWKVDDLAVP